jgi:hypothetical protein
MLPSSYVRPEEVEQGDGAVFFSASLGAKPRRLRPLFKTSPVSSVLASKCKCGTICILMLKQIIARATVAFSFRPRRGGAWGGEL